MKIRANWGKALSNIVKKPAKRERREDSTSEGAMVFQGKNEKQKPMTGGTGLVPRVTKSRQDLKGWGGVLIAFRGDNFGRKATQTDYWEN